MNSRSQVEAQVRPFRTLRAPFLSFFAILLSLLIAPSPNMVFSNGGYAPLVSLFLGEIKNSILPQHWELIFVSSNEPLEVYAAASLVLALLISSPMVSYQVMKFIVSVRGTRRTVYWLTAAASILLVSGTLFGYLFFSSYIFAALSSYFYFPGLYPPVIDAADFYFFALDAIAATAVVFTLPAYIYALVRFRR